MPLVTLKWSRLKGRLERRYVVSTFQDPSLTELLGTPRSMGGSRHTLGAGSETRGQRPYAGRQNVWRTGGDADKWKIVSHAG